ncbi:MAG: hypothetical protein HYX92_10830 [Chloroflexi bacterium]|nr:hypothetical protein [Chloroflexota bacterium]
MEIEKQGVPVATILSRDFAGLGQTECKALGFPAMPIVAVPHPFGNLKRDEVRKIADCVADEIVHVLTTPTEKLTVEYRDKYVRRAGAAPQPAEKAAPPA